MSICSVRDISQGTYMDKAVSNNSRGKRIFELRKQTRLSRREFCKIYNIPEPTMKSWEYGKTASMHSSSIEILVKAFNSEGISCSAEYLLNGEEKATKIQGGTPEKFISPDFYSNEIQSFYRKYPNAIHTIISDDNLLPYLQKGDIVLGLRINSESACSFLNSFCIIEYAKQKRKVFKLLPTNKNKLFALGPYNISSTTVTIVSEDEVTLLAPVIKVLHKV